MLVPLTLDEAVTPSTVAAVKATDPADELTAPVSEMSAAVAVKVTPLWPAIAASVVRVEPVAVRLTVPAELVIALVVGDRSGRQEGDIAGSVDDGRAGRGN